MTEMTTLWCSKETRKELEKIRTHPRETMDDLLKKWMRTKGLVKKETRKK